MELLKIVLIYYLVPAIALWFSLAKEYRNGECVPTEDWIIPFIPVVNLIVLAIAILIILLTLITDIGYCIRSWKK